LDYIFAGIIRLKILAAAAVVNTATMQLQVALLARQTVPQDIVPQMFIP
jgi:hypothetical protein